MFDFRDSRVTSTDPLGRMPEIEQHVKEESDHPLDSEEMDLLHKKLYAFYQMELSIQEENRLEQSIDEDFYDHIQWTEEDKQTMKERGQAPLVYNVIANSVNWVLGSEKRARTDFKILARRKEETKAAEAKTDVIKYLSDTNLSPFHKSRAFEDSVKVGLGWIETGVQDHDDSEPIYERYESWRNILHDSAATDFIDLKDCRYIYRVKWVDLDVAKAFFPDRAGLLEESVTDNPYGDLFDGDEAMDAAENERQTSGIQSVDEGHKRDRVRLIECWYRTPETVKRLRGENAFAGQVYDETDPRHAQVVQEQPESLGEAIMMRMRVAIFTSAGMIYEDASPYRHNQFPFTPYWGYRRGRTGLPYGLIRGLRDIQEDINKRASKALHILSTNKIIMDEGAVDDIDKLAEEVARPDAIIVKKPNKFLELNAERELAPAHLELMSRNIQMIQQVGGVTDELRGQNSQGLSGVAIQAVQEQGSTTTNKLFDNLRWAEQVRGSKVLSLVEQYMTEAKQVRITNAKGNAIFRGVNDGLPENDICRTRADFVISEQEWKATIRQANTEALTQLMVKMPPQVALVMLDLVVDSMDIANKDELVKRIRQLNGQRDPDAEPTPEEMQQMQQAMQEQQKQQAMQEAMFQAELADKQASAEQKAALAAKTKRDTIISNVDAAQKAIDAAQVIAAVPVAAHIADGILEESGWSGTIPQPTVQPQAPVQEQPPMNNPNGVM